MNNKINDLEEAAKNYEEDAIFYAARRISDFFKAGAQWQKEQMIEKACKWLSNVSIEDMTYKYNDFDTSEDWYKFIKDFKKVMEELTMALTLQCPHFFSISGIQYGCMLGKFPCNCETCDCPDKYYVETKVISSFATLDSNKTMTIEEKLSRAVKLADAMYYAAQQLSTDASRLRKATEAWWQFKNVELNNKE